MPIMTKRKFAAKLLFWLLPWPISKALPQSLRIYYWGPGAVPPPGWFYPPGMPGFPWPDPYNPPPPDEWPDLPPGPGNPGDPYVPGPDPGTPHHPIPPAGWITALDDSYWQTEYDAVWNVDHWDFLGDFAVGIRVNGEWSRGYRPTSFIITHDYGPGLLLTIGNAGEPGWAWTGICVSGTEYDLDFTGDSDADMTVIEHDSGEEGCDFDITNIEFFS